MLAETAGGEHGLRGAHLEGRAVGANGHHSGDPASIAASDTAVASDRNSMWLLARANSCSARWIAAPVWSPSACRIRGRR